MQLSSGGRQRDGELPSQHLRAHAATSPDRVALEVGAESITFRQLDDLADALAAHLLEGLGPGSQRVGHCVGGALAMIVADLAIERAGKVAVGLHPAEPPERLEALLGEVDASLVVTDLADLEVAGIPKTAAFGHPQTGAVTPAGGISDLHSIAYTSGSTGAPKGIMYSRRWAAHLYDWSRRDGLDEDQRIGMLFAGPSTSARLGAGLALAAGAATVVFDVRSQGIAELPAWIDERRLTGLAMVPTLLRALIALEPDPRRFAGLRTLRIVGETATWEDVAAVRRSLNPALEIRNNFGLTETGLVTNFVIAPDAPLGTGPVPAGSPMPGVSVSVIDENDEIAPVGEPGEIVAEGVHCAVGYWRRPDLSAETFTGLAGGVWRVRTGDTGLLRPDGVLIHLGRLDNMVKIAGHRVALEEVEAGLRAIEGVAEACASTFVDDAGTTRLGAHVAPEESAALTPPMLRAVLSRRLPSSMIPSAIEIVPALPRLAGGKIDRAGLPAPLPERSASAPPYRPPTSRLERALVAIWQDVLEVDRIGLDDDFFELGGDSLQVAELFSELERRLRIDRPASMLYEAPTIATFSVMAQTDGASLDVLVPFRVSGSRPPLFVVHAGGGETLFVRHLLPGLDADRPVYGIQPPLDVLTGRRPPPSTVQALARTYVAALRRVQPRGPYLLYGYSFGGLVAVEMAVQLESAGAEVALLTLGDTLVFGAGPAGIRVGPDSDTFRGRSAAKLGEIRRRGPLEGFLLALAYVRGHLRWRIDRAVAYALRAGHRLNHPLPIPRKRRTRYLMETFNTIACAYTPTTTYHGTVTYIRAARGAQNPDPFSWLLEVPPNIVGIPCDHGELVRPPFATQVGRALEEAIACSPGRGAPSTAGAPSSPPPETEALPA